ncbi:peptidoglycan-binding protein [Pseudomonas vancouverensis]|uniref:Peptidoglycan-binding protein n=1 Tax=Pseudomonas vancouverensis TaxID=95300 RepID=A0A4V2XA82_PSEVA|nr:peptidoglycan-binding protein [Pseudomonas vancouverensis]KAB0497918.1 peptidoglycan-binding protein [Pseudomonas vancouverensis]TDB66645.1 peptidoglycan-binding protein [Pseudomonas vancouverensis]
MRKSLLALLLLVSAGLAHGQVPLKDEMPTLKLSPQVRSSPLSDAVPAIALKTINSFLLSNRIVNAAEDFDKAPYIVAGDAERVLSGSGDRVFARGHVDPGQAVYGIFRQGKVYTDPVSHELLGINADDIGSAEVQATEDGVVTLMLQRTTQEVRPGDRLFEGQAPSFDSTYVPRSPNADINGLIIDVPRGVTQIGAMDVVTLNKGKRDGLVEGNVLAVMKTGETVRDRVSGQPLKIPDERAGLLMVFRTYDKLSYGLVLSTSRSLAVMDKVRNP